MKRRVFIISDLHLGGRPGLPDGDLKNVFQICNAYKELRDFIDWISELNSANDEELELVINGDIVDFLAEDDYDSAYGGTKAWTANSIEVCHKLEIIAERTKSSGQRSIFDALAAFLNSGKHLTFLLGNHDVELSLPMVRRKLRQLMNAAGKHFRFIFDGEAYAIGRLLIEHGNRYDKFNVIDHSRLRQERSLLSRGLDIDEKQRKKKFFVPPLGTFLVTQFINPIKSSYRYIDLLKPENGCVIPLILALEPNLRQSIKEVIALGFPFKAIKHRLDKSWQPQISGDLGGVISADSADRLLDAFLIDNLGDDAELFMEPEQLLTAGDLGSVKAMLGATKALTKWLQGQVEYVIENNSAITILRLLKARKEYSPKDLTKIPNKDTEILYRRLHAVLKRLNKHDRSYDLEFELPEYIESAARMAKQGGFEVIVFGHTHLPKQIPIHKNCYYFNTGTWADVLRLPDTLLQGYELAKPDMERFMEAMLSNQLIPYQKRYLSYVEALVNCDAGGAVEEAKLYSYTGTGCERSAPLTDLLGAQQEKKDEPSHR